MSYLRTSTVRLLLDAVALCGVVWLPWWVAVAAMIAISILWRAWEVPLIGLSMDLMWLPGGFFHPLPFFTLLGIALAWGFEPLRSRFLL